jgi:23S rRNA (cytidine2498-2'-O)-methyltransferase
VCDIVERPARIAALVADWIAGGFAQRAIFNLKLPMKKRRDEVLRCAAAMRERLAAAGVDASLAFRQLYHDREEVTGYLARRHSSGRMPRRR